MTDREVTYILFGHHSNDYRFGQHYSDEMPKLTLRSPINIQLAKLPNREEGDRYPTSASRFSLT